MKHRFCAVMLTILCAAPLHAQAVQRLTAEASVRLGLQHNARTAAAHARVHAADAAYRHARASRLPALSASAEYLRLSSNIPDVRYTLPGSTTPVTLQPVQRDRYQGVLSLDYSLFSGGRASSEIRAAAGAADAAQRYAEQADCDVAFDVRRAYWELQRAVAVRASLEQALDRVQAHLLLVEARFREGAALRRDLLAAQTRRSEVQLEVVAADDAVSGVRLRLNYLLGFPLDTLLQLAEPGDAGALQLAEDTLPDAGAVPAVAALRAEIAAQQARLQANEGLRWPQIDLVGRYLYAQPNPYFFAEQDRFRHSWELGVATRWSIWDGGRRSTESAELRALVGEAEVASNDAARQAALLLRTRRLELGRARRMAELAAQFGVEAEENFRVTREQFREGAALATDVLDAEEQHRRAQAGLAGARADIEIANAALLQARGRVWPP
jgi:outer membrane protein